MCFKWCIFQKSTVVPLSRRVTSHFEQAIDTILNPVNVGVAESKLIQIRNVKIEVIDCTWAPCTFKIIHDSNVPKGVYVIGQKRGRVEIVGKLDPPDLEQISDYTELYSRFKNLSLTDVEILTQYTIDLNMNPIADIIPIPLYRVIKQHNMNIEQGIRILYAKYIKIATTNYVYGLPQFRNQISQLRLEASQLGLPPNIATTVRVPSPFKQWYTQCVVISANSKNAISIKTLYFNFITWWHAQQYEHLLMPTENSFDRWIQNDEFKHFISSSGQSIYGIRLL